MRDTGRAPPPRKFVGPWACASSIGRTVRVEFHPTTARMELVGWPVGDYVIDTGFWISLAGSSGHAAIASET